MEPIKTIKLERDEQANLAQLRGLPGFSVLNKLAKGACDQLINTLLNSDPANKEQIVANFLKAQVAAELYTLFVNKVNEEMLEYINVPKASDKPIDVTEGVLDLGDDPDISDVLDQLDELSFN